MSVHNKIKGTTTYIICAAYKLSHVMQKKNFSNKIKFNLHFSPLFFYDDTAMIRVLNTSLWKH